MKLPFLNVFKKKAPTEYFLALLFRDEQIHAVVFEQVATRIQVIGEGKAVLPSVVEKVTDEELLDNADKAISIAEEALPENIQSHKTIFGVKESWVEDSHIIKNYLDRLKIVSEQLDLQPIGFLVFPEAIAHLLQKEEGAPVSAILIEVGRKQVSLALIRAGRVVDTKEAPIGATLTLTVEDALKSFEDVEIFPSRIILFDTGDEDLEKKFVNHKWNKTLPFLHVPQVSILPRDFDTRAVLFGTATQMGFDAIDVMRQPIRQHGTLHPEEIGEEAETGNEQQEEAGAKEKPEELETAPLPDDTQEEEQEREVIEKKRGNEENLEEVSGADTTEYFGFVKNADVAENLQGVRKTSIPDEALESVTEEIPEEEKEEEIGKSAPGFSLSGPIFVEGAKKILAQMKRFVPSQTSVNAVKDLAPSVSLPSLGGLNKKLLLIPLVILLLVGGLLWYIFGVHAQATLYLTPKVVSQDQQISFTTTGPSDPTKNLVAAQTVSVSEEGKVSGSATGTKNIGNPAKGTVTIFNSDTSPHTLDSGTVITASNGLTFTLDSGVTVASASGDIFSGTTPGTTDVNVTASDIGTTYNLPSQTKFSIGNSAVLAAKNNNAFSGGTSQKVTVVSQSDLDVLVKQLIINLGAQAQKDLQAKATGGEVILPNFTKTTAGITNFDKKVGDQSQSINLDGTITYESLVYQKSDIESYTKEALSGKLPTNMTLAPNGISYDATGVNTKNGTTSVTLTIKAALLPILDTTSLAKQIAGQSFIAAKDTLSNVPQFSDAVFTLSPNFFFLPHTLPRMSGNITVSVAAQ